MSSIARAHGTGRTIMSWVRSAAGDQPIGGASIADVSGRTAKGEAPRGPPLRKGVKRDIDARAPRPRERSEQRGVGAPDGRRRARPQGPKVRIAPHPLPGKGARPERREDAIGRRQMKMLVAGQWTSPTTSGWGVYRARSYPVKTGRAYRAISAMHVPAAINLRIKENPARRRRAGSSPRGISRDCRGSDATRSGCRSCRPRRRTDWRRSGR